MDQSKYYKDEYSIQQQKEQEYQQMIVVNATIKKLFPKILAGLLSDKELKEILDTMNIILNMLHFTEQEKAEIVEIATKIKQGKSIKKGLLSKWFNQ